MGKQKWNHETAKATALNHETKMTLWEDDNGCYGYIRKHDLWDELAPHIPNPPRPTLSIRAWDSLKASMEALKHNTRAELREAYPSCASWISRHDLWDIVAPHLKETPKCRKWRTYYENNPFEGAKDGIFYVLEFKHQTLDRHFVKVGITSKSIEERYKCPSYNNYNYNILVEYHTTNLISAEIEDNLLTLNNHNRYCYDNHINFDGYTETLDIKVKEGIVALEELHQLKTKK